MSIAIVATLLVVAVLVGIVGLVLFGVVIVWFLRRRSAPTPTKHDPEASTVIREHKAPPTKETKATPAPLTPASAVRGDAPAGDTASSPLKPPAGLAAPPPFKAPPPTPLSTAAAPPPPSGAKAAAGPADAGKAKQPGPLLGFFDDDKPQEGEAKTELFSRDMAARYAAMLDDEDDEGEHTELFSAAQLEEEVASAMLDDETGAQKPTKLPGKVVAEEKK